MASEPSKCACAEVDRADGAKRSRPPGWATALAASPLLYVLSFGPAENAAENWEVNPPSFNRFYAPLLWLHSHTFLKQPLDWYVGLWSAHQAQE